MTTNIEVLINVAGVLAVVATSVLVAWRWRESDTARRRPLAGLVAALLSGMVIATASAHLCLAGDAYVHMAVGAGCVFLLVWAVRRPIGVRVALAVSAATLALAFHTTDLAHRGYPTNPRYATVMTAVMQAKLRSGMATAAGAKRLAAGPVERDVLVGLVGEQHVTAGGGLRVPNSRWRWFTPITGMREATADERRVVVTDPAGPVFQLEAVGG